MTKIVVVGAGHMGTAVVSGLLNDIKFDLQVVDPSESRRIFLKSRYGIDALPSIKNVNDDDILILSIPPQKFSQFAKDIKLNLGRTTPVISMMAGIKIDTLGHLLGVSQIIRAIPNTLPEIALGMTVFCASPNIYKENLALTGVILGSFGKAIYVTDESLIDSATALCGGGPAFIAYFASAMQSFAIQSGFSNTESVLMIAQILRGTADLLELTRKSPTQI
ncbi:pyrroline-5-carboxylate reductase dimerization domain-containing protein, partial [Undibacterium sp. CCC1.1]